MPLPTQLSKQLSDIFPLVCKYHLKMMPSKLKIQLIGLALNHFFKEAISDGELEFLKQKTFTLYVDDLDYATTLSLIDDKLVACPPASHSDVTLRSTFNPLILLISRKEDPDTLFFNRALTIEGNTALVLEIKNWLDSLDFDLLPKPLQKVLLSYSDMI